MNIHFTLNGEPRSADVPDGITLLDFLRDELHVHSVRRGCENAECGACTVLLDGAAVNACIFLAVRADGHEITTVEGLGSPDHMSVLQEAFVRNGAVQCGFCGSGMVLSAMSLLNRNSHPSETEIREGIAGNLCRCSGYTKIVEAIRDAAERLGEEQAHENI